MATVAQETTAHLWRLHRWLIVGLVLFFGVVYLQYALKMSHSEHGMRSAFLRCERTLTPLLEAPDCFDEARKACKE